MWLGRGFDNNPLIFSRLADKSITFEISIGNAGNSLEGYQPMEPHADLSALVCNSNLLLMELLADTLTKKKVSMLES